MHPMIQNSLLHHHDSINSSEFCIEGAIPYIAHYVTASDMTENIIKDSLPTAMLDAIGITFDDYLKAMVIYSRRAIKKTRSENKTNLIQKEQRTIAEPEAIRT